MDWGIFKGWLDAYGRAWQTGDLEATAELFTKDAAYHETPFDEPMRGREEIVEYWSDVPRSQDEVRFSYEILGALEEEGIAQWNADYRETARQNPGRARRHLAHEAGRHGPLHGVLRVVTPPGE